MLNVTIRGLFAHKARFVSTFLAVILGIGFLSGTLVLTDTIKGTFNDLFADVNRGTDALRAEHARRRGRHQQSGRRSLANHQRRDGSHTAADINPTTPSRAAQGHGNPGGAPTRDRGQGPRNPGGTPRGPVEARGSTPFHVADGRAPTAADEVVIDKSSATKGHLKVGDTISIVLPTATEPQPVPSCRHRQVRLPPTAPSETSYARFTLPTARHVLTPARQDRIDQGARPERSVAGRRWRRISVRAAADKRKR